MIEKFYYFPYKRFPTLLYRNRKIFETKLFKVFYNKLFPNIYLMRVRRDNVLFNKFFETLFFKNEAIPNNDIQLVYCGYEKIIYFGFDNFFNIKNTIWHKEGQHFIKERFLGYPIYFDYSSGVIKDRDAIIKFMINHWKSLKADKTLHGDFTHMNILIDDLKKITAIDAKVGTQNSLISDHFYFYAYFLYMLKKHRKTAISEYQKLKLSIEDILRVVFECEDKLFLHNLVESIKLDEFSLPELKTFIKDFKINVLKI